MTGSGDVVYVGILKRRSDALYSCGRPERCSGGGCGLSGGRPTIVFHLSQVARRINKKFHL